LEIGKSQGWLGVFILHELEQTDVWWRRRTRMKMETDVNLFETSLIWKSLREKGEMKEEFGTNDCLGRRTRTMETDESL